MTTNASPAELRRWARENGYDIGDRGRISSEVQRAYAAAKGRKGSASRTAGKAVQVAPAPTVAVVQELWDALEGALTRIEELEAEADDTAARLEELERRPAPAPAPAAVQSAAAAPTESGRRWLRRRPG